MGRRIKFEKHETSLFLFTSTSARFIIETRTIDGTGPVHETRMVLYKQTCPRSLLYLLCQLTTSSERKFSVSSKWQCRDHLHDNMPASALDKVAGDVLFDRKPRH